MVGGSAMGAERTGPEAAEERAVGRAGPAGRGPFAGRDPQAADRPPAEDPVAERQVERGAANGKRGEGGASQVSARWSAMACARTRWRSEGQALPSGPG